MNINKMLGKRVKSLRKAKNLTQEELSERADIDPTYISDIERGKVKPSVESISKIANGLNINLSKLLSFGNEKKSNQEKIEIISELNDLFIEHDIESLKILKNFIVYAVDYFKFMKMK